MGYPLKNVKLFHWWCNKVLPLVYDDSLSYYEVLCKIMSTLKELIEVEELQNNAITDLDERVTTAEGDIDALEGRMETAENDIDNLEERMDTAEGDIDDLEGRMDTAEGDIDGLKGRMDTAEGDIDSLEGRMDTAEGDIDALETTTGGHTLSINSLTTRMGRAEGDIITLDGKIYSNEQQDKYVLENLLYTMGSLVDSFNPKAIAFGYYDEVNEVRIDGDYFETGFMDVIPGHKYYVKDLRYNETPTDHKPVAIYLYGKRTGLQANFISALDLSTLDSEDNDYYSFTIPNNVYTVRVVFHRGNRPVLSDNAGKGWGYFGYYANNPPSQYANPYWSSSPAIIADYIYQYLAQNNVDAFDMTQAYNAGDFARLGLTIIQAKNNIAANTAYSDSNWKTWSIKALCDAAVQHDAQLNGFTIHSVMTQTEYDNLGTYDSHTIYPIKE